MLLLAMESRLELEMQPQPDDFTCGATCMHALYRYYGEDVPLGRLAKEVPQLEDGGTMAVLLGVDALRRGYQAVIYTYNLQIFDPTWFVPQPVDLRSRIARQMAVKTKRRMRFSSQAYLDYLDLGGRVLFEDLTPALLRQFLKRGEPILCGLSATYLYRCPREKGPQQDYDDVAGVPMGHFVVLCGYDPATRAVLLADPLRPNPMSHEQIYTVPIDRLICAILLGTLTYDANLLIVRPGDRHPHGHPHRRQHPG
jgi:hypothetical protein